MNAPFQTFGGEELFPTLRKKGASLCYGLIKNHSFQDGNKRSGILIMITYLELNGLEICCTDDDIISLGLSTVSGEIGQDQILEWIMDHS